jgi:uncharacterized protein YecT (DUF1311 family)
MCRTLLAAALTTAICALAAVAHGQATPAELPSSCAAYQSVALPPEAAQTPAPKTSPACASYRSYRGIDRPVNYAAARACAWQERAARQAGRNQNMKEPTAWVVGGSLILADIYINGAGVKRNIPLAMRFACETEESTAMLALPEVMKLNDSPAAQKQFEFCDYAATTFTEDFCADYASQIGDDRRNRYYDSLKSSMTPDQKAAFEKLLAARNAYIQTHASEVDQSGTIHAIRTLTSENILKDLFHTELVHFERKQWPALSQSQIAMADRTLQREYESKLRQLQAQPKEAMYPGAVTADHLAGVEKAWEAYRDAWVEFARLRYPAAVAPIRAEVTLARYRLLKTI